MLHGIIFWGNLPYSNFVFKIQRRIIRIIVNARYRDFCHLLFKKLNIPIHIFIIKMLSN